jgi:hypothetical protein
MPLRAIHTPVFSGCFVNQFTETRLLPGISRRLQQTSRREWRVFICFHSPRSSVGKMMSCGGLGHGRAAYTLAPIEMLVIPVWASASISCGERTIMPAPSPYGGGASAWEISSMANLAQVGLFILACAFLSGLTLFLFRDQITSRTSNARLSAVPQRVAGKRTSRRF